MSVQSYTGGDAPERSALAARLASPTLRKWIVAVVGCAVMAMSGGGLAGYLDLSSATAATPPQPPDAPPIN
jgi:hypothetical protein